MWLAAGILFQRRRPSETGEALGGKKERNPIRLSKPSTVLFPSGQACEVPAKLCILGQMRNTCHPRSPVTKERCRRCVLGPALGAGCCCLVALRHGLGIEGCSAWKVPGCDPRCWHSALGQQLGLRRTVASGTWMGESSGSVGGAIGDTWGKSQEKARSHECAAAAFSQEQSS